MASAALISITLMPVLLYYLAKHNRHNSHPLPQRMQQGLMRIYQPFGRLLTQSATFLSAVALLGLLALLPIKFIASEFMPPLDEGDLLYMPTTAPAFPSAKPVN